MCWRGIQVCCFSGEVRTSQSSLSWTNCPWNCLWDVFLEPSISWLRKITWHCAPTEGAIISRALRAARSLYSDQ